jgi:hypothetical protein
MQLTSMKVQQRHSNRWHETHVNREIDIDRFLQGKIAG